MPVKYWDYWTDSTTSTSTTATPFFNNWTAANSTATTTTCAKYYINTYAPPERCIERYLVDGFDDWSDHARAVLTRLVNDETTTGFKIAMWIKGDVEITDPGIMHRDLDWFLLRLRQLASQADYEKIAAHVAQVRAQIASGTEAGTGETEGLDPKGDGPTAAGGDAPKDIAQNIGGPSQ